jgi:hypothetical protein
MKVKVKEMKKMLAELDDEDTLVLRATPVFDYHFQVDKNESIDTEQGGDN